MSLNKIDLKQNQFPKLRLIGFSLICIWSGLATTQIYASEKAEDSKSEESDFPVLDEAFLAFLAQTESVDETFLDPLDMLEMDALESDQTQAPKTQLGSEPESKNLKASKKT